MQEERKGRRAKDEGRRKGTTGWFLLRPSSFALRPSALAHRPLPEEAQQRPVVRRRGRDLQPVDARRAETAGELLLTLRGPARHVIAAELDRPPLPRLGVD